MKPIVEINALAAQHRRSPADLLEWWAERAAIREYDGGQSREAAERDAMAELREALSA